MCQIERQTNKTIDRQSYRKTKGQRQTDKMLERQTYDR